MAVDTKHVTGRRELRFNSIDEVLAEAERLAASDVKTIGNWSLGQIFAHLAIAMGRFIDGFSFKAPLLYRIVGPMMKKKFLNGTMPSGFQFSENMKPDLEPPAEISTEEGLQMLRDTTARFKNETKRSPSPFLGKMTIEEYNLLHQRHSEMHLSFAIPQSDAVAGTDQAATEEATV